MNGYFHKGHHIDVIEIKILGLVIDGKLVKTGGTNDELVNHGFELINQQINNQQIATNERR